MFQLLFLKYFRLVFILLCIAVLSFNTDPNVLIAGEIESVNIEKAEFKSSDKELKVEVKIKSSGEDQKRTVKLFDAITDELLGEKGSKDETIKFKFEDISGSNIPCSVRAIVEGFSDTSDVNNAPDNCSNGSGQVGGNEIESVNIVKAEFKSSDKELIVEVKIESSGEDQERTVKLFDAITDELLGEKGSKDETIKFKFEDISGSNVPCRVLAMVEEFSDTRDVNDAPDNCSNGNGGGTGGGGTVDADNIIALHDKKSPQYDKNCIACHAAILDEESLDPSIETAHVSMLSNTPGKNNNERCGWCHRTVDLLGGSAGNLRKQVKADLCAMCHGNDGFGVAKQYYHKSITDGKKLYELACASCHKEIENSEVKGEDAQEIRDEIEEDEGGMKPLEELSPSQIQAIADALAQVGGGGGD